MTACFGCDGLPVAARFARLPPSPSKDHPLRIRSIFRKPPKPWFRLPGSLTPSTARVVAPGALVFCFQPNFVLVIAHLGFESRQEPAATLLAVPADSPSTVCSPVFGLRVGGLIPPPPPPSQPCLQQHSRSDPQVRHHDVPSLLP